jgi:hypothetical protein
MARCRLLDFPFESLRSAPIAVAGDAPRKTPLFVRALRMSLRYISRFNRFVLSRCGGILRERRLMLELLGLLGHSQGSLKEKTIFYVFLVSFYFVFFMFLLFWAIFFSSFTLISVILEGKKLYDGGRFCDMVTMGGWFEGEIGLNRLSWDRVMEIDRRFWGFEVRRSQGSLEILKGRHLYICPRIYSMTILSTWEPASSHSTEPA